MSWIKWTHGLSRKPEVMQIAYRLGRSRHEVAGLLMEWWEWTDVNVNIDESASGFDPDACPGVVRVGADGLRMIDAITGVEGMAEALVSVGWASIENGNLVLPNFGRHNGKSAKARALDAARKRADRRNSVRKASGSKPDKIRNRGEEKRGDKKVPSEPTSADKPPPKEKPRNPLFDAVAEVTGYDPATAGGLLGSVAAALAKADPPYTPEDVREFARQFVVLCPYAARDGRTRPEPKELQTHIGKLRNSAPPPTAPTTKPAGGFKTKAEKDKYILARQTLDAMGEHNIPTPEEWK